MNKDGYGNFITEGDGIGISNEGSGYAVEGEGIAIEGWND